MYKTTEEKFEQPRMSEKKKDTAPASAPAKAQQGTY